MLSSQSLRRLACNQTINLNLCRNVGKWFPISFRFLNNPNHHKNIRIATCYDIRNSSNRTIEDRNKDHGISRVLTALKGNPYVRLMRMDKPIGEIRLSTAEKRQGRCHIFSGSWLLFWPCGWSVALSAQAGCLPDLKMLAILGAGSILMRGAGCTINDMWDKDIDSKVQRTSTRPLVTKEISILDAWFFLGTQLGISLLLLLQLNWNTILLGTSALGLVIIYPLMKRITDWPQFVLGLTFNWGALMGYSAVHGEVLWSACLPLYAVGVCWTIIYDTIYAHQDRVDDLIVGVKSTALKFGKDTKKWLTGFGCLMTSSLLTTGLVCDLAWPYYASALIASTHVAHQIYSLNIDDPADCARKFISNNHVGLLIFGGLVFGVLLQNPDTKKNKDPTLILQSLASTQVQMQQK